MERCNRIINHIDFQKALKKNNAMERTRRFCRHGMEHYLDTARIGYILILEKGLAIDKELIYAAALLHDIARYDETPGRCHDAASADMAAGILEDAGFLQEEIQMITEAIRGHRHDDKETSTLGSILYTADKLSRRCFECGVWEECYWSEDKKNHQLTY